MLNAWLAVDKSIGCFSLLSGISRSQYYMRAGFLLFDFDITLRKTKLQKIIDYIDRHIYEEITVTDIAKAFYISQSTLERRFNESLDLKPLEYIRRKKLLLAAEMLREGKTVFTAGANVGYHDNSYFIELFKKYYGITPYQYKQKWNRPGQADSYGSDGSVLE